MYKITDQEIKNEKKILEEMIKGLNAACKRKEIDYGGLGKDLLVLYKELIIYHHDKNELIILRDLKNKLEGIKKWEAIDYNKEVANSICQYLKKQTQLKEQAMRK